MSDDSGEKPAVTLPARVEKIVPGRPEKAQINLDEGADHLYREVRIENKLTDKNGNEVKLKQGAKVEVTVEANPSETLPKNEDEK